MERHIRYDEASAKGELAHKIWLQGQYEARGPFHCIDATVTVHLKTVLEGFHLGRFCVEAAESCISGEEPLPEGIVLHWKMALTGQKLCFSAKACKDFGDPVGTLWTPEEHLNVEIEGRIAKK